MLELIEFSDYQENIVYFEDLINHTLEKCLKLPEIMILVENFKIDNSFLLSLMKNLSINIKAYTEEDLFMSSIGESLKNLKFRGSIDLNNIVSMFFEKNLKTKNNFLRIWSEILRQFHDFLKMYKELKGLRIKLFYEEKNLQLNRNKLELTKISDSGKRFEIRLQEIKIQEIIRKIQTLEFKINSLKNKLKQDNFFIVPSRTNIEFKKKSLNLSKKDKKILENNFGIKNILLDPKDIEKLQDYYFNRPIVDFSLDISKNLNPKDNIGILNHFIKDKQYDISLSLSIYLGNIYSFFKKKPEIEKLFFNYSNIEQNIKKENIQKTAAKIREMQNLIIEQKQELSDIKKIPEGVVNYNILSSKINILIKNMEEKDNLILENEISLIDLYLNEYILNFLLKKL